MAETAPRWDDLDNAEQARLAGIEPGSYTYSEERGEMVGSCSLAALGPRYPLIARWGRALAQNPYDVAGEILRAIVTHAPPSAVHEYRDDVTGIRTGRWATIVDVPTDQRQRMGLA